MNESDEQNNLAFKRERHNFCFQTFYSNIRVLLHPKTVNSEGSLCAFQKTVPKKNPHDSYKLAQNCYTVPRYNTKDIYLYLISEKVMYLVHIFRILLELCSDLK